MTGSTDDTTDTAAAGAPRASAAGRAPFDVRDSAARYGLFVVLAGFILVFSLLRPDTFFTLTNFQSMINSQSIVLLLAIAATIVLRTGDFDLSIAAVMTTTAATSAG